MANDQTTFLSTENDCHPQLQSAFHFVSVLCHPAWSIRNDLYYSTMEELWARNYRIRKVLNKTTLSEIVGGVQTVIPKSKLAQYGDFRYDWTTEELYKNVTCPYGADFKTSELLQPETEYNWDDDVFIFDPKVQQVVDCVSIPVDSQGDETLLSRWLLVLQHLLMDVQRAAFQSSEIKDKWTNTLIETCAKFVSCLQFNQSLDNIINMPCIIDFEQLCLEPVCREEILSIEQPAIEGDSKSKDEQNAIERLWLNISLSQIRSLWIEDAFSTKYGVLPDSLSYAMGEISNIVPVTNFLNRELTTMCESSNGHVFVSDKEAKHLLGDLLDLLNVGDHGSVEEHPMETVIQEKCFKGTDHSSLSKSSLRQNDSAKNIASPILLTVSDLKDENAAERRNQSNDSRPQSSSATERRNQSNDSRPRSSSATEAIIKTDSVMISNTSRPSVGTVNIPPTTVVTGERVTQVPFFYMPHIPLTVSPLRVPQTLPFYQQRAHLQDHGQYVPTITHPYPTLTPANPSQLCYYHPPSPITFVTPTAYSPQAVSPQIRPSLRFPTTPSALPFYPPATHLQYHLSSVPSSRFPQAVYQLDHNWTANFTGLRPTGTSSSVRCETHSSTCYSLQNSETVRPLVPVVPRYVQPRLPLTGNQSRTQHCPFSVHRTYVPFSSYCASLIPVNDQYYSQTLPRSAYLQTYHAGDPHQCVDQLNQSQDSCSKPSIQKASTTDISTADPSSSSLSQLSTCSSTSTFASRTNIPKSRINVRQLANRKKASRIQQKIPKCKSLLKSVYSKNRTEKLKLSDFLFLGQPSTSSFGKRKCKKELFESKKDDHLKNPLNSDTMEDLKTVPNNPRTTGELTNSCALTDGNCKSSISHSVSVIVTERSNILDATMNSFNLRNKALADEWSASPVCKHDFSADEDLGLSLMFNDDNPVDERLVSSMSKYNSDTDIAEVGHIVMVFDDDASEFSVHQEPAKSSPKVRNSSTECLLSLDLSEGDEAFDMIKYDQVLYSLNLDLNSFTL